MINIAEILKPGMVGVNLKRRRDPLGTFTTLSQGDTEAAHVWRVRSDGTIATTGAKWGVMYGYVEAASYLLGKTFYLLETIDPLTDEQLRTMDEAEDEIQGINRFYGFWRYAQLYGAALQDGSVEKLGKEPNVNAPAFPICSQAVGYPYWKAGVPVGKMFGKEDYTALLPETFLKEALAVAFLIRQKALDKHVKPCYYFHLVKQTPFKL